MSTHETQPEHTVPTSERVRINTDYSRDGLTSRFVFERLNSILAGLKLAGVDRSEQLDVMHTVRSECFYSGTSDDLNALSHLPVQGRSVLCVAGSGEAAQLFAFRGARKINLFDRSWSAILWNELKLVSNATLSYDQYRAMFCLPT